MPKKILLLVEEMYEDLEFWYPKIRLEEAGIKVVVAAPEKKVYHGKKGLPAEPDMLVDEVKEADFSGIVIPGGYAPDKLRRYPKVLELVRQFDKKKKLVAFICHAGWVPISAKILKGRQATSFFAIRDDMVNAGVVWEDSPAVIDGNLVSSRTPQDLGPFCQAILKVLRA
jgi:protease I